VHALKETGIAPENAMIVAFSEDFDRAECRIATCGVYGFVPNVVGSPPDVPWTRL
jgi:hypothetical protein